MRYGLAPADFSVEFFSYETPICAPALVAASISNSPWTIETVH